MRRPKWSLFVAAALTIAMAGRSAAQTAGSPTTAASHVGILLMAHGGGKSWNGNVESIASEVNRSQPTEVAFGMADRTTLQAGIDKLVARGVTEVVAVPLFVSSHSSVIESTKYLLGLRPTAPADLADFASMDMDHVHDSAAHGATSTDTNAAAVDKSLKTTPVKSAATIRMAPALDHHPMLAEILTDRALAISRHPEKEVVILVAHGPNDDPENNQWLADLHEVATMIGAKKPFVRVDATTVRDDAEAPVRDAATQDFRKLVSAAYDQGDRVLIVPVLLSYGGIENGIRLRLDGLDHVMSPAGLLPDPRIAQWVLLDAR
jgi:sirohydrochlorin ferrochelatase